MQITKELLETALRYNEETDAVYYKNSNRPLRGNRPRVLLNGESTRVYTKQAYKLLSGKDLSKEQKSALKKSLNTKQNALYGLAVIRESLQHFGKSEEIEKVQTLICEIESLLSVLIEKNRA